MVQVSPIRRVGLRFAATPDVLSINEAEVLARALSRYTPTDEGEQLLAERAAEARAGQDFLDEWAITDARLWDPRPLWDALTPAERLIIPLGKGTAGRTTYLDIKETAEGGVGPHGMLTGQTGSGKSKHLRAIVLAMAMKHPPEVLQILLGDFKGEAEFAGLERLPHCVGVVSNLERSVHKLDRFQDVVTGEMNIRQETLRKAGFEGVREYEMARATTRPELEPIGTLLIVLDEFSALLEIRPEMAKVFDNVGRQGRALWVHILNASQRVESGKMQGLMAQQNYSIGMKVKDAGQSRQAIGSPRAYEDLKNAPQGSALLVVDGEHTRYRSFFTKAPFIAPKAAGAARRRTDGHFVDVHRFGAAVAALPEDFGDDDDDDLIAVSAEEENPVEGVEAPTIESVLVDQIVKFGQGRLRRTMWLPPLDDIAEIGIDELAEEFWGRRWDELSADSGLVVPIAREDSPLEHTQNLVSVNLSGAMGNVGIAGATGSGKSMAIRTLMASLAISHSPQRVQFYGIDYGGGKLASMAGLPHVCGIAGKGHDEKIRRVIAEVERLLRFRERHWGQQGIDVSEFRARKFGTSTGAVPEDGHGDVFFIIDNIKALQLDSYELHQRVAAMAESALNYAIHLIVANDQWMSINPPALEQKLRTRIELRLEHHVESMLRDKKVAEAMPDQPGRALQSSGTHMLVGVPYPRREGTEAAAENSEQQIVVDTATAIGRLWADRGHARAPELQVLPTEIGYDDLPAAPPGVLKLGIGENEMSTVGLDLARAPHFYAVGASLSGRTTVLRTLLRAISDAFTPEQAQVVMFDPDYKLADAIDARYRAVYATTASQVGQACSAIAQRILQRQPPAGTPPEELGKWRPTGPKWFIVVDDLNLLTTAGTSQSSLLPLVSAIETGRQRGLHVLAATNVERWYQTGRSSKVIGAMDTGGAGVLVMDGSEAEHIIDKVRPAKRVPGRGELYYRKYGGQLIQVAVSSTAPSTGGEQ